MRHLPYVGLAALLAQSAAAPGALAAGKTERASVATGGAQAVGGGDLGSINPTVSADGRHVAFQSEATNLVPGDTNGAYDVFVRDRQTGRTERINVSSSGVQSNGDAYNTPAMSADGRYVAFGSGATNLVPGGTDGKGQIFVRDRRTGTTVLASVGPGGVQADDDCYSPLISADGRHVAFYSSATNLVPGDAGGQHAFVHDLRTRTTERASVSSGGAPGNDYSYAAGVSSNGRYVAFWSAASNLVRGDTNGKTDIFVRDRVSERTERVSVSSAGAQANSDSLVGWISGDGRYVVFHSDASNLVKGDTNGKTDVFVRDRRAKTTERVSVSSSGGQINGDSLVGWGGRTITQDGRYVAFYSYASNVVAGDTNAAMDVFLRDRVAKTTERVSVSSGGAQGDDWSYEAALSGDGSIVAFHSSATNLVPGDTNGVHDIFVRAR